MLNKGLPYILHIQKKFIFLDQQKNLGYGNGKALGLHSNLVILASW